MYQLWRDAHLLLGLFFFAFILMFAISSLQFSHRWLESEAEPEHATVAVDPARATTPRALARHLMEREGYRGELHRVEETEDRVSFSISRMGTVHDVDYAPGAEEAHVRTRVFPFITMLVWMHAMFGVQHEYALHNVWGGLMFLASVGLLAIGGTGLYLWLQLKRERRVGLILLVGHGLVGAVLIARLWIG